MIRSLETMLPIKRENVTSTPILVFTEFNKPFKLHTNASAIGLGAFLYQQQDGKDRVTRYASRALSKSEY